MSRLIDGGGGVQTIELYVLKVKRMSFLQVDIFTPTQRPHLPTVYHHAQLDLTIHYNTLSTELLDRQTNSQTDRQTDVTNEGPRTRRNPVSKDCKMFLCVLTQHHHHHHHHYHHHQYLAEEQQPMYIHKIELMQLCHAQRPRHTPQL